MNMNGGTLSMKRTLEEKLHNRQVHTPSIILYWVLMLVVKIVNLIVNTSFTYKAFPGKEKGPFVLISNHASRNDYLFTAPVCLPRRLNYVVGYNEFVRFPNSLLLKLGQAIPKKNFTPDTYTIKQILRIIKSGGCICIMPEGMSSITGMAQPVIPGGAKMLKKLGVPVYYTKISGGYLTYTKHCLDERRGKCEVVVDKMFTPEDLKNMSVEQIEDTMNRLLAHDDYIWNKEKQVSFNGKGQMAKKLDTLLYMCPKCGEMYKMECSGNFMKCTSCGNTIAIDEKYNISPAGENSVCPSLVTDWTIMERDIAAQDVKADGFIFSEHVKVGTLPKYKQLTGDSTSVICGEGLLSLTHDGLSFDGILNGDAYKFTTPPQQLPTFGMCTDISRFYTFVDGEFIEFYPDNNDVLRWDHLVEELHRYSGGKWQNTQYRHEP